MLVKLRLQADCFRQDQGGLTSLGSRVMLRLVSAFLKWWSATPRADRRTRWWFGMLLALICAAALYIGAPPAAQNAADFSQFWDGGWMVLNGQRPHSDFYSTYGVFTYF